MEQARRSRRPTSDIAILRGHPLPLGATVQPDGINFAIASRYATAVTLLLFLPGTLEPLLEVPLDARFHRTGEVWHAFLKGLEPGIQYAYRMDWEEHTFELPDLSERRWCRVIDTMQMPPHDIAEPDTEAVLTDQRRYVVGPRSVVVLIGKMYEQSRETAIYEKG